MIPVGQLWQNAIRHGLYNIVAATAQHDTILIESATRVDKSSTRSKRQRS